MKLGDSMKALITGASSGIGREIAKYLDHLGYELILVGRDKERLEKLSSKLTINPKIIILDLTNEANAKSLYVLTKNEDIDILVNNAGFGNFGYFSETDLTNDLNMINLNIKTVHILTKMFLKDMKRKNYGYILNVASTAGFYPGPLMATYYSTKSYTYKLTQAISYELKKQKSNVHISCLCPGPVATNFNKTAGVEFAIKPYKASYVAKYAIDKMFKNKTLIIPGIKMKLLKIGGKILSDKTIMRLTYRIQKKKVK